MIANKIILAFIHLIEKFMNFHDFVTGCIVLIAISSFIYFFILNKKMRIGIMDLTNDVDNLTGTTDEKMVALNEIISSKKNKVIRELWNKYYETLLKQGSEGSSVDIVTYFNRTTLVDIPTQRKIAEIMPGTLISCGILGTFTGLVVGLNTMDVSTSEAIKSSMVPLMSGLKVGFLASVLAIGTSLLWNLLDRIFLHKIVRNVNDFQVAFEQQFPSESLGSYLVEMIKLQNAQASAVEKMNSNMSNEPKKPTNEFSEDKIFSKLTNAISNSLEKNIQPLTQSITSLVDGLSKELEQRSIADQQAASAASSAMHVGSVVDFDASALEILDKKIDVINNSQVQINDNLNNLHSDFEKSNAIQTEINEDIKNISENIKTSVGSAMTEVNGGLVETISNLTEEVQNNLKSTFDEEMRKVTIGIGETVNKMDETIDKTAKDFDELKESLKVLDNKLGDKVLYGAKTKRSDGEFY